PDADIEAKGNVNLLAGREANGTKNYLDLTVHGDELNASAIPITSLHADGEITQNHSVNVAAGADIRSARDVNLIAERFGNAGILAYGEGKNWLTELASGIDSALGSDGVSEKF